MKKLFFAIAATFASFLLADSSTYEAIAGLCDSINGCVTAISPPCQGTGGNCSLITLMNQPQGGNTTCSDTTAATYWKATQPTTWADCMKKDGMGPCKRKAQTCEQVLLFS